MTTLVFLQSVGIHTNALLVDVQLWMQWGHLCILEYFAKTENYCKLLHMVFD